MFAAETAVLVHFKSVRIILLVFVCVIISLLALGACQCDLDSHFYRHLLIEFGAKLPFCAVKVTVYLPRARRLACSARPRKAHTKKTSSAEVETV